MMKNGDLILERSGGGPRAPVGRVALIDGYEPIYCSNFCQQLRFDRARCNPRYVARALWYRYSSGVTARLEHQTTGIRNLDYAGYLAYPILLPPLSEQRVIAAVLDSIDEAIERTEAVIAAIERLRDALLHELLTRGVPGWHSEWKEAPGIGTVPACWEAERLLDHCNSVQDGDWIESRDQSGSDYRLLQLSNIGIGEFIETGNFRWITDETFARLKCIEVMRGDVLVARMPEPIGRALYISDLAWRSVTVVDVAIIRTNPKTLNARFLSNYLNSPECLWSMAGISIGTTRKRIRRTDIERIYIPLPSLCEQRAIASILECVDEAIARARDERDGLDSWKVSGQTPY